MKLSEFFNKIAVENKAQNLHETFKKYGAAALKWRRRCELLLPDIYRQRIWKKKGYESIYVYAAKLAGMSQRTVDESLRIFRNIEDKKPLLNVARQFGLHRVRAVAAIATHENAEYFAEKARKMSKHTFETFVREYKKEILPGEENGRNEMQSNLIRNANSSPVQGADFGVATDHGAVSIDIAADRGLHSAAMDASVDVLRHASASASDRPPVEVTMQLPFEVFDRLQKLKGQSSWGELMGKLLSNNDGEKPEIMQTEKRYIPAKIKKYVLKKYGGRCAFPGCVKTFTSLHHTQRFASERVHDPDRLVPVCDGHERLAHLGLIAHEDGAPHLWHIRKEADPNEFKYYVDQMVANYRIQKPLLVSNANLEAKPEA
ncbi:MAG: hypothetical protein AAB592_04020 [Patescibacteria group bacterium]